MRRLLRPAATKAASDTAIGTLPGGTEIVAASLATGRRLLTTVDDYVRSQSVFDRQARVNLQREVVEVTQAIYLDYVASQVMAWSPDELEALRTIVSSVASLFAPLSLRLPAQIHLVKTSGQEEGYAAYTRRLDTIVLPTNMVASVLTAASYGDPLHPSNDLSYLQNVFIHECFHLFSKNHPETRRRLYQLVHYRILGNAIELPNVSWGAASAASMRELKIANPDEPDANVCIDLVVPSDPAQPSSPPIRRPLAPILLASGPYAGGVFFEYLHWWFLAIEEDAAGHWAPVLGKDGRPLLYDSAPLMPQYLKLVGKNFTQEIFQPDEILAQSFVLVANQPSLGLLLPIADVLSGGAR